MSKRSVAKETQKDNLSPESPDETNLLETLLLGLDLAAFEVLGNGELRPLARRFPDWFSLLFLNHAQQQNDRFSPDLFPFLKSFFTDANEFWKQEKTGRIRSDHWIKSDEKGNRWKIEVSAIYGFGRRRLLVLQPAQKGMEQKASPGQSTFSTRAASRRQKTLEPDTDRYEALSIDPSHWILVVNASGVCVNSKTHNPEFSIFQTQGRHLSEIFPPHVLDRFLKSVRKALRTRERQSLGFQWETGGNVHYYHARFGPASPTEVICVVSRMESP